MWWELGSLGELTILEAEGGALVGSIQLAHVQHVGRTKVRVRVRVSVSVRVRVGVRVRV